MDDGDDMSFINQALSRTQENGGLFGMPFLRTLVSQRPSERAALDILSCSCAFNIPLSLTPLLLQR